MSVTDVTREELWAKQHLSCKNIDYAVWERDKSMLRKLSRINGGCSFVVDVYKGCYAYASTGFVDWLGYDRHKIETLEKQGDYSADCISVLSVMSNKGYSYHKNVTKMHGSFAA